MNKTETTGLAVLGTKEVMIERLETASSAIEVVHKFVNDSFVKNIDYGPADQRTEKDSLLKPGAEKVCNLFGVHPEWDVDKETHEYLKLNEGDKKTICYICRLIDNRTGKVIGTGRGAETVGNKARDINKTIKIAQKNAFIDAALYTFCLSDRFTQDGGAGANNLQSARERLMYVVQELRAGVESELTDQQWIVTVTQRELHRKDINSIGACNHLERLIKNKAFDFATGEKAGAATPIRKKSRGAEPLEKPAQEPELIPPDLPAPGWLQKDGDAPPWDELKSLRVVRDFIGSRSRTRSQPPTYKLVVNNETFTTKNESLARLGAEAMDDLCEVAMFVTGKNEIIWLQRFANV